LLTEFLDAAEALAKVRRAGLIVRDVRSYPGLNAALRITIGSTEENARMIEGLS
jgi:histidinol-phosphate aminotransferase